MYQEISAVGGSHIPGYASCRHRGYQLTRRVARHRYHLPSACAGIMSRKPTGNNGDRI